jgi:hypothetical protein
MTARKPPTPTQRVRSRAHPAAGAASTKIPTTAPDTKSRMSAPWPPLRAGAGRSGSASCDHSRTAAATKTRLSSPKAMIAAFA